MKRADVESDQKLGSSFTATSFPPYFDRRNEVMFLTAATMATYFKGRQSMQKSQILLVLLI